MFIVVALIIFALSLVTWGSDPIGDIKEMAAIAFAVAVIYGITRMSKKQKPEPPETS